MSRVANVATPEQVAAFRAGKLGAARAHGSHTPGRMNKTEARYAEQLELQRRAGVIAAWTFEPTKLRLALRTFLTPDFAVVTKDGATEYHEVKGRKVNGRPYVREDAMLKLKFAAERYPQHRFLLVWPASGGGRGGWSSQHVPGSGGAT